MSAAAEQLDIFEAFRRREAGQDLAIEWASIEYKERLTAAIKVLAASGESFCSDDIRARAGETPTGCSPNVIGAIVQGALRSGLIHTQEYTRSARVKGHGNIVCRFVGRRQ